MNALAVDLYALTMTEVYLRDGVTGPATFSLFARKLPADRGYLIAAGLEAVIEFLQGWRFSQQDLDYLDSLGKFSKDTLDYLARVRFDGELRATPEGRAFFADEPIIEVTAPIPVAQLLEAALINLVQLPSLIATKASRCVEAAQGRTVVDFALRRTQGIEAGLAVARASYLAGAAATSNVWAGQRYGIPVAGTIAHSFIQAFPDELAAFRAYARVYPDGGTLLVDTYDSERGIANAITVAKELEQAGRRLGAIRLDSGDLLALSQLARRELDQAGLHYVQIFASGGLDEYEIERLVTAGAKIDGFGVGTKLGVSYDAPALDLVYKLVSYNGRPVLKLSPDKQTWIGAKQVWRRSGPHGVFVGDVLSLADEPAPDAEPLLETVMSRGKLVTPLPTLVEARERCKEEISRLPVGLRRLRQPDQYHIEISARLRSEQQSTEAEVRRREGLT